MFYQYQRQMMPMVNRDEDLRHLVESYEMKLRKGEFIKSEEAKITEEICQRQNEFFVERRRIWTSADLHNDTVRRGEVLLRDIERDTSLLTSEMQKDRSQLDDADLDL